MRPHGADVNRDLPVADNGWHSTTKLGRLTRMLTPRPPARRAVLRATVRATVLFFATAAVWTLAGCKLKPRVTAPGTTEPDVSANCADWATVMDGPYRYENNVWGQNKATRGYEQCLLRRTVQDRVERGWAWNWPGFDASVYAYPEIIFGWKPWTGGESTDPRFPMKVANIAQLDLHYEVETEASGSYNLAPEIWLTRSGRASPSPNPNLISTEIMFWMDYGGKAKPAGQVVDQLTIGAIDYEVWRADNFGAGGKWTFLAFKSRKIRHAGVIDMHAVLRYSVERNAIDPSHYVASVEFGNEIMGGRGRTWVREFSVAAREKAQ